MPLPGRQAALPLQSLERCKVALLPTFSVLWRRKSGKVVVETTNDPQYE